MHSHSYLRTISRNLRVLNVVDNFNREGVLQVVDFFVSDERVGRAVEQLATHRRMPAVLVCDYCPKFTSKSILSWTQDGGAKL